MGHGQTLTMTSPPPTDCSGVESNRSALSLSGTPSHQHLRISRKLYVYSQLSSIDLVTFKIHTQSPKICGTVVTDVGLPDIQNLRKIASLFDQLKSGANAL